MNSETQILFFPILALSFVLIAVYAYFMYRQKNLAVANKKGLLLSVGSLLFVASAVILLASCMRAEQFTGASGTGRSFGFAAGLYEISAAAMFLIAALICRRQYLKT